MATRMSINVPVENPFGFDEMATLHCFTVWPERLDKAFLMLRSEKAYMIYIDDTVDGHPRKAILACDGNIEVTTYSNDCNSKDVEIMTPRAAKALFKAQVNIY